MPVILGIVGFIFGLIAFALGLSFSLNGFMDSQMGFVCLICICFWIIFSFLGLSIRQR